MTIMFPFFIWLDMKGWFRSDPLDEIIGLDTSYHGGCMLGSNHDKVGPNTISVLEKSDQDKQEGARNPLGRVSSMERTRGLDEIEEEEESNYFETWTNDDRGRLCRATVSVEKVVARTAAVTTKNGI